MLVGNSPILENKMDLTEDKRVETQDSQLNSIVGKQNLKDSKSMGLPPQGGKKSIVQTFQNKTLVEGFNDQSPTSEIKAQSQMQHTAKLIDEKKAQPVSTNLLNFPKGQQHKRQVYSRESSKQRNCTTNSQEDHHSPPPISQEDIERELLIDCASLSEEDLKDYTPAQLKKYPKIILTFIPKDQLIFKPELNFEAPLIKNLCTQFSETKIRLIILKNQLSDQLFHSYDQNMMNIQIPGVVSEGNSSQILSGQHELGAGGGTYYQYYSQMLTEEQQDKDLILKQLSKKNPNFVLDNNQEMSEKLQEILHERGLIQKNGNIKLNGILIKGAPSLGTKFNPNFKDKNHNGLRPQSRGLTQGNIIQMASKALASISSPMSLLSGRRNRFKRGNTTEVGQRTKMNQSMDPRISSGAFMMRGTKKHQIIRKRTTKSPKRSKNHATTEIKSRHSQGQFSENRGVFAEQKIIKSGGQHGNDQVKLKVKFTRNNQPISNPDRSNLSNRALTPDQGGNQCQSIHKNVFMSNDSHFTMSEKNKDGVRDTQCNDPDHNRCSLDQSLNQHNLQIHLSESVSQRSPEHVTKKQFFRGQDYVHSSYKISPDIKNRKSGEDGLVSFFHQNAITKEGALSDNMNTSEQQETRIVRRSQEFKSPGAYSKNVFIESPNSNKNHRLQVLNSDGEIPNQKKDDPKAKKPDSQIKQIGSQITVSNEFQRISQAKFKQEVSDNILSGGRKVSSPASNQKRSAYRAQSKNSRSSNPSKSGHHVRKGQPIKDFIKQLTKHEPSQKGRASPLPGVQKYMTLTNSQQKSPVNEIKVISLHNVNFQNFEQSIYDKDGLLKTLTSAAKQTGSPQIRQQDIISSDKSKQLNSMNSDDKIKTEKIGDVTISPANSQRQNESLEINEASTNKHETNKTQICQYTDQGRMKSMDRIGDKRSSLICPQNEKSGITFEKKLKDKNFDVKAKSNKAHERGHRGKLGVAELQRYSQVPKKHHESNSRNHESKLVTSNLDSEAVITPKTRKERKTTTQYSIKRQRETLKLDTQNSGVNEQGILKELAKQAMIEDIQIVNHVPAQQALKSSFQMKSGETTQEQHDVVGALMKPKGITLFQTELMKSEHDDTLVGASQQKNEVVIYSQDKKVVLVDSQEPSKNDSSVDNTPDSLKMVKKMDYLTASMDKSQKKDDLFIQENEIGCIVEEKPQFRTGEGSMIEPKTSFFTSSQMKEEQDEFYDQISKSLHKKQDSKLNSNQTSVNIGVPKEKNDTSPLNYELKHKIHGKLEAFIKKTHTLNIKKKKIAAQVAGEKDKVQMVDIDNIQYTDNSSNANSLDKSEIMNQIDISKFQYSSPTQKMKVTNKIQEKLSNLEVLSMPNSQNLSIPLNNQDVVMLSRKQRIAELQKEDSATLLNQPQQVPDSMNESQKQEKSQSTVHHQVPNSIGQYSNLISLANNVHDSLTFDSRNKEESQLRQRQINTALVNYTAENAAIRQQQVTQPNDSSIRRAPLPESPFQSEQESKSKTRSDFAIIQIKTSQPGPYNNKIFQFPKDSIDSNALVDLQSGLVHVAKGEVDASETQIHEISGLERLSKSEQERKIIIGQTARSSDIVKNSKNMVTTFRIDEGSQENGENIKRNSLLVSNIISESLLDCRDIGIGAMIPGDEIEQLCGSQDILHAAIQETSTLMKNHEQLSHLKEEYRPIQQVNVQLLSQNEQVENSSNMKSTKLLKAKHDTSQHNKSSALEKTSAYKSDFELNVTHTLPTNSNVDQSEKARATFSNRKQNFKTEAVVIKYNQPAQNSNRSSITLTNNDDSINGLKEMSGKLDQHKKNLQVSKSMERKSLAYDRWIKQRRVIIKSPNPNDGQRIQIGDKILLEADTLLNGRILTDQYKIIPQFNENRAQKDIHRTQLMRQEPKQNPQKDLSIFGKHIDASKTSVKAEFEHINVKDQQKIDKGEETTLIGIRSLDDGSHQSKIDLQKQLKGLSLDQLRSIHEILKKGGQIVRISPISSKIRGTIATQGGILEPLQQVSPMSQVFQNSSQDQVHLNISVNINNLTSPQSIGAQLNSDLQENQNKMMIINQLNDQFAEQLNNPQSMQMYENDQNIFLNIIRSRDYSNSFRHKTLQQLTNRLNTSKFRENEIQPSPKSDFYCKPDSSSKQSNLNNSATGNLRENTLLMKAKFLQGTPNQVLTAQMNSPNMMTPLLAHPTNHLEATSDMTQNISHSMQSPLSCRQPRAISGDADSQAYAQGIVQIQGIHGGSFQDTRRLKEQGQVDLQDVQIYHMNLNSPQNDIEAQYKPLKGGHSPQKVRARFGEQQFEKQLSISLEDQTDKQTVYLNQHKRVRDSDFQGNKTNSGNFVNLASKPSKDNKNPDYSTLSQFQSGFGNAQISQNIQQRGKSNQEQQIRQWPNRKQYGKKNQSSNMIQAINTRVRKPLVTPKRYESFKFDSLNFSKGGLNSKDMAHPQELSFGNIDPSNSNFKERSACMVEKKRPLDDAFLININKEQKDLMTIITENNTGPVQKGYSYKSSNAEIDSKYLKDQNRMTSVNASDSVEQDKRQFEQILRQSESKIKSVLNKDLSSIQNSRDEPRRNFDQVSNQVSYQNEQYHISPNYQSGMKKTQNEQQQLLLELRKQQSSLIRQQQQQESVESNQDDMYIRERVDIVKPNLAQSCHSPVNYRNQGPPYKKVQKMVTQIQVSRKSQPLNEGVDISRHFNQEAKRSSLDKSSVVDSQKYHQTNSNSKNESSQIGGSSRPKTQSFNGVQRMGKKTVIHSDIQQYELYLQLQQMKKLGEQMQSGCISLEPHNLSPHFVDQPLRSPKKDTLSKPQGKKGFQIKGRGNRAFSQIKPSFFCSMSQKMKEVFSPQFVKPISQKNQIGIQTSSCGIQTHLLNRRNPSSQKSGGGNRSIVKIQNVKQSTSAYSMMENQNQILTRLKHPQFSGTNHGRSGPFKDHETDRFIELDEENTPKETEKLPQSSLGTINHKGNSISPNNDRFVNPINMTFFPASRMLKRRKLDEHHNSMNWMTQKNDTLKNDTICSVLGPQTLEKGHTGQASSKNSKNSVVSQKFVLSSSHFLRENKITEELSKGWNQGSSPTRKTAEL